MDGVPSTTAMITIKDEGSGGSISSSNRKTNKQTNKTWDSLAQFTLASMNEKSNDGTQKPSASLQFQGWLGQVRGREGCWFWVRECQGFLRCPAEENLMPFPLIWGEGLRVVKKHDWDFWTVVMNVMPYENFLMKSRKRSLIKLGVCGVWSCVLPAGCIMGADVRSEGRAFPLPKPLGERGCCANLLFIRF